MLSGGSLGHPGILPWFLLRHRFHEYFVVRIFVGIRYCVAVKKDSTVISNYGIFRVFAYSHFSTLDQKVAFHLLIKNIYIFGHQSDLKLYLEVGLPL